MPLETNNDSEVIIIDGSCAETFSTHVTTATKIGAAAGGWLFGISCIPVSAALALPPSLVSFLFSCCNVEKTIAVAGDIIQAVEQGAAMAGIAIGGSLGAVTGVATYPISHDTSLPDCCFRLSRKPLSQFFPKALALENTACAPCFMSKDQTYTSIDRP